MSIEFIGTVICDGCGKKIQSAPENRSSMVAVVSCALSSMLEEQKWMILSRGKYLPNAHYCPKCADKPHKPISKKKSLAQKQWLETEKRMRGIK